MKNLGFLVERNDDDTLSVLFSDKMCFDDLTDDEIDDVVFGYFPDAEKIQVFTEDDLYALSAEDDTCH